MKLNGALGAPWAVFGHEAYPTLEEKAAVLLYHVARAHAWWNGNKRMALVITLLFLAINDRWWTMVGDGAYKLVCYVADDATKREDALKVATGVFAAGLDPLPDELAAALAQLRARGSAGVELERAGRDIIRSYLARGAS